MKLLVNALPGMYWPVPNPAVLLVTTRLVASPATVSTVSVPITVSGTVVLVKLKLKGRVAALAAKLIQNEVATDNVTVLSNGFITPPIHSTRH